MFNITLQFPNIFTKNEESRCFCARMLFDEEGRLHLSEEGIIEEENPEMKSYNIQAEENDIFYVARINPDTGGLLEGYYALYQGKMLELDTNQDVIDFYCNAQRASCKNNLTS